MKISLLQDPVTWCTQQSSLTLIGVLEISLGNLHPSMADLYHVTAKGREGVRPYISYKLYRSKWYGFQAVLSGIGARNQTVLLDPE